MRTEVLALCGLLGVVLVDIAASYQLLYDPWPRGNIMGLAKTEIAKRASAMFVWNTRPFRAIHTVVAPLVVWALGGLIYRLWTQRKALDLITLVMGGMMTAFLVSEVVPSEKALKTVTNDADRVALLGKILFGHFVLGMGVLCQIIASLISQPAPPTIRTELLPLWVLIGQHALMLSVIMPCIWGNESAGRMGVKMGSIFHQTYLDQKLNTILLALVVIIPVIRLVKKFSTADLIRVALSIAMCAGMAVAHIVNKALYAATHPIRTDLDTNVWAHVLFIGAGLISTLYTLPAPPAAAKEEEAKKKKKN